MSNTVEYKANSRCSHVNIVHHENGKSPNNKGQRGNKLDSALRGKQPNLFERASSRWWDIRLDSKILEDQFKISSLPQFTRVFRQSLLFTLFSSVLWIAFILATQAINGWVATSIWSGVLAVICIVLLLVTKMHKFYQRFYIQISVLFLCVIMVTAWVAAYHNQIVLAAVTNFFIAAQVIVLIYLILPFPIPITFATAIIFSIVFELLLHIGLSNNAGSIAPSLTKSIISHVILHLVLHLLSFQLLVNLQILRHSTFWKICQAVHTTQERNKEANFKNLMITTVMPLSVAEKLIFPEDDQPKGSLFRPFTMEKMEDVSILYADIVGFTKMSANKTAAELVGLLNDLFGRFDRLCEATGCEKISTLGDCYYCVAGCPESCDDHAECCVEMGLGMISAIKEFCRQNNINVNMRVGIHTGYVLCGIVGTKRFKFDVWSNDVTLANGMEQHGIPGRIHISQKTLDCLGDKYIVEDSKLEERDEEFMEKTGKTYLIVKARDDKPPHRNMAKKNGNQDQNKLSMKLNNNKNPYSQDACNNVGSTKHSLSKMLDVNHSSKEPLLFKRGSKRKNVQQNIQPVEHANGSQDSLSKMLKQDQLMEYLGQHTQPFTQPGPLIRLRRDEDTKLINSIKDDPLMSDYYRNKEVNSVTMWFRVSTIEQEYRGLCEQEATKDEAITMSISSRYRLFRDIVLSSVVTLLIFISSILLLESGTENVAWIIVFIIFFIVLITLSVLGGLYIYHESDLTGMAQSLAEVMSTWTMRHILGTILLFIPAIVIFAHMSCRATAPLCSNYLILFCVVILHFLNYDQLMSWMRSCLACIVGIIVIPLIYASSCPQNSGGDTALCLFGLANQSRYEVVLDIVLLLIFVWYINWNLELGYRLEFYSDHEMKRISENKDKEKRNVDALLDNFIPPHVSKVMTDQHPYSKTHKNVGVVFGTIVNFNELYEESFEGGMQFIRYLSELISDVDELLNKEEFKDVEKIKTIGTTFMLASGLNPSTDQETNDPNAHLPVLMEFCKAMQDEIDAFNKDMLNFQLVLRIGFNHGEVTAGVIGTTKRLYDIWGDTVNTASRMDSTGVPGRIQVSEESKKALDDQFNFKAIGKKFVKGKGDMETYLLVRDDEDQRVIIPNPTFNYPPF